MKTTKLMLPFILLFAGICIQLNAATLHVTNSADSGAGSLRDAIAAAAAGDNIAFDNSTNGIPIVLTTGHIVIDKDLTINGNGISNTIIDGNDASRIFNITAGNVTVHGLTIQNGATFGFFESGGGVASSSAGIVNIDHCVFLSCVTQRDGGGIATTNGTMNITACTFDGNHANFDGGGIRIDIATITIEACTFTNNTAENGGGIRRVWGFVTVKNTTLSGNTSGDYGGGFFGEMTLINCTVANNHADNQGGGGISEPGLVIIMFNCIVYNNTATGGGHDLVGFFASGGYNIIGDISGLFGGLAITDMVINPMLDTLADNGGPTKTIALLCGSPAIDAADTTTTGNDQRGIAMFGGRRDIGAFEVECPSASLTGIDSVCAFNWVDYTTQAGMTNYVWTISGTAGVDYIIQLGGGAADNSVELQWRTNGNHTVTVSYTDPAYPCCNVAPANFTTYVAHATNPSPSGPADVCVNEVATYAINPPPGSTYLLNISGSQADYTIISGGGLNDSNITVQWLFPGMTSVDLSISSPGCQQVRHKSVEVHSNPICEITGDEVFCSGGSTTLDAGSHSDYLWSTAETTQTISVNTSGTYTVTVSNASGCTESASITVTQAQPLVATCSGTNVTCNGGANGTAAVTVTGGMPEAVAQYFWSNGATTASVGNLTAGTYTVTVTKGECSTSTTCSYTVTEPAALVATCSGTNVTCNGGANGTAAVTVTGGVPEVVAQYLWSNGASTSGIGNLTPGTYTVTVTRGSGCSTTCSYTVTAPAALTVDAGPNKYVFRGYPDSSCTTLQSTISGGTLPYTRQWSTAGSSNLGSGISLNVCSLTTPKIYYLTVTDANGCSKTDSARVCVFDVRCGSGNKKVTICHGTGSASNPFQTLCILPADAVFHFMNHPGEKLGTCGMNRTCSFPIMPNRLDEMTEEEYDMSLTAYPNPASETINISFYSEDRRTYSLRVINITGQIILSETKQAEEGENNFTLNLKGFAAGMYTVLVQSGDNVMQTRIVKQ